MTDNTLASRAFLPLEMAARALCRASTADYRKIKVSERNADHYVEANFEPIRQACLARMDIFYRRQADYAQKVAKS